MIRLYWMAVTAWRLRGYHPQKVTFRTVRRWVNQFPAEFRSDLLRLAAGIRFVTERETIESLLELNQRVLDALAADDIPITNVVYVQTDKAGSSSAVMLNLLRDRANLERRGAHFLDSKDLEGISQTTAHLQRGAIVYVDDFAGSGKQFTRARRRVAEYVHGAFSEFFLLPCICEEALERVTAEGVEAVARIVHRRAERPFRDECPVLPRERRAALVELCRKLWGKPSLGFDGLATHVVFYRNAPNTTPLVFRGHLRQTPIRGILPRYDDLAVP